MPVLISVIGLLLGVYFGLVCPGYIPAAYTTYAAVALLAAFDSVVGGINAQLKHKFRLSIFTSGFFINMLLAVLLTYLGTLLQIDLYLAAVVVFGTRIFQNLAGIRRIILNYIRKKDKITV